MHNCPPNQITILFNLLNKNDRLFVNPLNNPYLSKLPDHSSCRRRLILTYDEENSITDKYGTIDVLPTWKWLLETRHIKRG